MGSLPSQQEFHQGDPLWPFLFALVLQKVVLAIGDDNTGSELGLQCWYIDDGVLAGRSKSVLGVLNTIQQLGPTLGLNINLKWCELFGAGDLSQFPNCITVSQHVLASMPPQSHGFKHSLAPIEEVWDSIPYSITPPRPTLPRFASLIVPLLMMCSPQSSN